MTAIVLLNWNGYNDTIACISSLYSMTTEDFFVIIADNNSTDESLQEMTIWCQKNKDVDFQFIAQGDEDNSSRPRSGTIILYSLSANYGFAKGNNLAVALASRFKPDYYLVLNNDTEVSPDFLEQLFLFSKRHPDYEVLSPLISFYNPKDIVWNCGGKLFAGLRKYHYAGKPVSSIKEKEYIPISFITGCALFFTDRILDEDGRLFTERFFFGEEDFAFSIRMKKEKRKMACVLDSRIYHKVGRATAKLKRNDKRYVYFLNRYIDVRLHYSPLFFFCWSYLYYFYIALLLRKAGSSIPETWRFIRNLHIDCRRYDGISQEMYFKLMNIKES